MANIEAFTDVSTFSAQKSANIEEDEGTFVNSGSILLAEDNLINQKVVSAILNKAGYPVTIVEDGKAAVEQYISAPDDYDLILMDIHMPKLDGLAATREIRKWETDRFSCGVGPETVRRRVCIIAITAGDVLGENGSYSRAGMDDLLYKPVRRDALVSMIERWMGRQRQEEKSAQNESKVI